MRSAAILLCLIGTAASNAASEIRAFAPGVTTAYAVIRQADGDVWYPTAQAFEVWGTGARTAADYDIALTDKGGDMFVGDFDANVAAGSYTVAVHYQAGGAPADTDPIVWTDDGYWSTSVWTLAGSAVHLVDTLADTSELQADWTDGGRLDLILDAIKAMTDLMAIVTTTVADSNDANDLTLTAGQAVADAYWMHAIMVEDGDDNHCEVRWIEQYDAQRDVLLDEHLSFDPVAGDRVWVLGPVYGGLLYEIRHLLNASQAPVYIYNRTGSTSGGGGDVTRYLQDGSDP